MSKIKFYFIVLIAMITVSSCNKDNNDEEIIPPKPYAEQYPIDIAAIENYLNTHYISDVVNKPGFPEDQDVTISEITDASSPDQRSLMSYLNSNTLPRLTSRNVETSNEVGSPLGGLTYKIYTLVIREGVGNVGVGGEYPCNMDAVFAGYKGTLLDGTVFDSSNNGQTPFDLSSAGIIRGWSEAFPQFKTGWVSSNQDGTVNYNDFGVGVMFLPSAMGYYGNAQAGIPAYSPLVFSVKLYALKRADHDADGIPDFQEDVDPSHNRYMYVFATGVANPDDSDGDGIPDFLDIDDDNDTYSTRGEIKDKDGNYYAFDKIPDCSGDQTIANRLKRHLDKNCTKMNQ
ncbi:FKBP-type peptidyl-prolyl cis-trans isomerase [Flavobacterium sp. WC2509]|uniref:FKBP-type peptidyl-prolyl cis-trans isomerase n=1 Tax=Flavobacterium sp. WC2509 TaxID=3461406 RepID=UPI00404516E9